MGRNQFSAFKEVISALLSKSEVPLYISLRVISSMHLSKTGAWGQTHGNRNGSNYTTILRRDDNLRSLGFNCATEDVIGFNGLNEFHQKSLRKPLAKGYSQNLFYELAHLKLCVQVRTKISY